MRENPDPVAHPAHRAHGPAWQNGHGHADRVGDRRLRGESAPERYGTTLRRDSETVPVVTDGSGYRHRARQGRNDRRRGHLRDHPEGTGGTVSHTATCPVTVQYALGAYT